MCVPNPSPAGSLEFAEIRGEKNWRWGGEVPNHLDQTNYAEMCILVTKYISKLNKIPNTNYMPCI